MDSMNERQAKPRSESVKIGSAQVVDSSNEKW